MKSPQTAKTRARRRLQAAGLAGLTPILLVLLSGCADDVWQKSESDLRRTVTESAQRETADAARVPQQQTLKRESGVGRLEIPDQFMPELEKMAGPASYPPLHEFRNQIEQAGRDLVDRPIHTVGVSLQSAVRTGVENNLAVQFARLAPAVSEAQVVAAQAAFDWVFFSNLDYANTDEPRIRQTIGSTTFGGIATTEQNVRNTSGVRRPLISGGQLTVQQELTYIDNDSPNQSNSPDPANQLGYTLQFDQPLLRNFGSGVTLAEVRLTRNAERNSVQQLRRDLIRTITDIERTYWQLVRAQRELQIVYRLYERGVEVRDILRKRRDLDANSAQIADAVARTERRRADVMRSQNQIRQLSDRLKSLINDPRMAVGSEVIVAPVDQAIDAPIEYSLLDAIQTAINNRPEVAQAILSIDDTSIRQNVADNQRLPRLDLRLQTRFNSLEENMGTAYGEVFDGQFISYLLALQFEQPLGNRKAEADFRRRRLERSQAVLSYRNTIQQVLTEVKNALNNITTNYRLIEQTQISRFAAAEVLRTLRIENEKLRGLTVERLDLELTRQESLASAERDEIAALTDYNISIAEMHAALGTALERNHIDFVVPQVDESQVRSRTKSAKKTDEPAPGAIEGQ